MSLLAALPVLMLLSPPPCTAGPQETSHLETLIGEVAGVPTLPECASPLMKKIFAGALTHRDTATTAPAWMATAATTPQHDVYIGGGQIFPAFADIIERAEHDLTYQTYQFEAESWPAQQIFNALARLDAKAKAEGRRVKVRVLLDSSEIGMGTPKADDLAEQVQAQLASRGLRLHLPFEPDVSSGVQLDLAVAEHLGQATYHVKTITRDGVESFITGANTAAYWGKRDGDKIDSWYDVAYRFDGELTMSLRSEFTDAWSKAKAWGCRGGGGTFDKCGQATKPLEELSPTFASSTSEAPCTPIVVVGSDMRESIVGHLGEPLDNTLNHAVLAAVKHSQRQIRMQTPIFNSEDAEQAVKDALKRGLALKRAGKPFQIQIILSKGYQNWQKWIPGNGNGGFFGGANNPILIENLYGYLRDELKLHQDEACELLQVRWFSSNGRTPVEGKASGQSHHKYYSFDDSVVAVGSMNMDHQSWYHARELLAFVDNEETTKAWDEQVFEANFARAIVPEVCRTAAAYYGEEKR